MNLLKNILFFGLLIVVLCGVYFALKQQPESPLPKELANEVKPLNMSGVPDLAAPGASIAGGSMPTATGDRTAPPPFAPATSIAGGGAPSFPAPPATVGGAPSFPAPPATVGIAPGYPAPSSSGGTAPSFAAMSPPPAQTTPGAATPFTPSATKPADPTPPPRNYPSGVAEPSLDSIPKSLDSIPKPPADPFAHKSDGPLAPPPAEHAKPSNIDLIIQQVDLRVHENNLPDALSLLSQLYDNPDVPEAQSRKITEILDALAAKVIFSREHLLERPYVVQPGDTLDSIADQCKVPSLLLARINGVGPQDIRPGKELKVLKGPFSAHLSIARSEMKLVLEDRYAVRFPVAISSALQHTTGFYHVQAKSASAADGSMAKPQWIELSGASGKIGIEATPDLRSVPTGGSLSTVWLSEQDMDDLYGILSIGSALIIQQR